MPTRTAKSSIWRLHAAEPYAKQSIIAAKNRKSASTPTRWRASRITFSSAASRRTLSPGRPQDTLDAPPFPGLSAFTEEDAGIFFGRDTDILRGLDKLRRVAP